MKDPSNLRHGDDTSGRTEFILAGVALLLGVPVYNAQRRHVTLPEAVPAYR